MMTCRTDGAVWSLLQIGTIRSPSLGGPQVRQKFFLHKSLDPLERKRDIRIDSLGVASRGQHLSSKPLLWVTVQTCTVT